MTQPRPDEFKPPPECPVFEPSWEEFADPFAFINKIRPIAEKTGICKVRPPPNWQPPFACDVDRLHFTPRIQRLNELEAQTRVKLNFLDQIAKFWELQGCSLKIPHVERKILDLYHLNKLVADEGGFDIVCRDRRWTKIALQMGFAPGKAVGSHLRAHYERILYPYNLFQTGNNLLAPELASKLMRYTDDRELDQCVQKPVMTPDLSEKEYKLHDAPQRTGVNLQLSDSSPPSRRAKRMDQGNSAPTADELPIKLSGCVKTEPGEVCENRPNLRRRMGSLVAKPEPEREAPILVKPEPLEPKLISESLMDKSKGRYRKTPPMLSVVDLYVCLVCGSGTNEDKLLLCDGCDDSYHTFCLIPPLCDVPRGDWRCPKCLAQECGKPPEAFGFEQARRDYSLRAFGEMADNFKSDYFNMPVHMVPTELVEKEFWRLVSTIEEDVTVEYGADIASKEFGSGFPIRNGRLKIAPADEKYLSCGWNLNNMAMMNPSVLTHVTADICGMTLPWLYVGMCFSSFCWHIEDHWSYSINYLHWGEPKTWYGAPGYAAEQLEGVMRKLAPELFELQPDLLHQLVTIMNPNTLMSHGVPIYRTNQCAGEFVITFPRAYHSGFNQGFNFAEAVNFCTVDWMALGRQCVDHYRLLNRYCVFSHDEMICNMASKAPGLDVVLASAVHRDMASMLREEKELRERVRKMGVVQSEVFQYDLLADDERQCVKCRTTCFLSALTCPCRPGVQVCLHHAGDLCSCPFSKYTLKYRFTLDDLYPMMKAVKKRAEPYNEWAAVVTDVLEAKLDKKRALSVFRSLIEQSERQEFPDSDLLRELRVATLDAEKCSSVAQQLLNGKRQTRLRSGGVKTQNQLTVEEVRSFVRQLYNLPCSLPQAPLLKELLNRIEDFQQHSEAVLSAPLTAECVCELEGLLEASAQLDVALPELPCLRSRLEQARWLREVQQAHAHTHTHTHSPPAAHTHARARGLTLDAMRRLIDQGVGLSPNPALERAMARLQELLTVSETWEEKAHSLLRDRPMHSVEELRECVREVETIPAHLPNCLLLQDTLRKAKDWLQEAEAIQQRGRIPVLDSLSDLITRGRSLPVHLEPLARLEGLVAEVMTWKESAAKTFLLKSSTFSLLEVLCPRCEVGVSSPKRRAKKEKKKAGLDTLSDVEKALSESTASAAAMQTLEAVRAREMECVSALRASNESKLLPAGDCDHLRVCVCQRAPAGAMLQCELCRDAFHSVCVRGAEPQGQGEGPWLCPQCQRSQRPPMDRILPLLAALQRTRVRLPEGDALRFLIERTVAWQRRARQVSASCSDPALLLPAADKALQGHTPDWNRTSPAQTPFYIEQRCIPLQGLKPELEALMVEGLLLQASLPETQQLYRVLLNGPISPHSSGHGNASPRVTAHGDAPKQSHCQGRSPQKEECVGVCEASSLSPAQECVGVCEADRKPKRRVLPVERVDRAERAERVHPEALCQLLTPRRKRARISREHRRHRQAASASASPSARSDLSSDPCDLSDPCRSDDSEDEALLCPAEHCQQPEGDEVFWVQCDGSCNQWFHMMCVGVTAELAEKEDYVCVSCVGRK
ncbi:lysine-specific demethylase 5B-B isoform X3 [Clupea harengus]|uniref:[histone H3]-trimethyl-L-lysine(4) demethylase n=1 Tax=Clupea harengus TaxID=7950 RepID=A0A6P8FG48_CLUHA|nr:lysine-specific demethylase 5B-B isoform X3 [Clupea harengus]